MCTNSERSRVARAFIGRRATVDLGIIGEVRAMLTALLPLLTQKRDNPNFAAMAEAVGIRGIRLEDAGEVESGIAAALAHDGPVLVDAVVNRTELAMPTSISLEMARSAW
jgi:pyruvate dehydrogenase (quinone)